MKFYFHPDAKEELDKAVDYYDQCQSGLGLGFSEEVYAVNLFELKKVISSRATKN